MPFSALFFRLFLLSCFFMQVAVAQEDRSTVEVQSPYHSIINHLQYLQEDEYRPELALQSLDFSGAAFSMEEKKLIARKLKQIFDGRGHYIDPDVLPTSPNYADTITHRKKYVPVQSLPSVYLVKVGDRWLYSKSTVAAIPELFEETYPLGTAALLGFADYLGQGESGKTFMGLHVWQYIALMMFVLLSIVCHRILVFLFNRIIYRVLMKLNYEEIATKVIAPVSRPLSYTVVTGTLLLFFPALQLPIKFAQYVLVLLESLMPVFLVMVTYRLIDVVMFYLDRFAQQTDNTLDDQLVPIVRKALKVMVVVIGTVFVLQNLDFDITGLLAGISIGGLAFALAAQDTIKNLFGSLMIFVDRPFQIGDWITASGVDGTVEEVGFRSTRVRTFHNSVVTIPNGHIADMTVDNMGLRKYRRFSTSIGITYDTPADKIEAFTEGLRNVVANHPHTYKDFYEINLNTFGDFSLNIMFYIFFNVPDWSKELRCRHEVMLEIIKLAEHLEVRFAFPTSTLHIEEFPDKNSLTPVHALTQQELQEKVAGYSYRKN